MEFLIAVIALRGLLQGVSMFMINVPIKVSPYMKTLVNRTKCTSTGKHRKGQIVSSCSLHQQGDFTLGIVEFYVEKK